MASGVSGGSPVFQSTTVAPSASSNTASMRPRTTGVADDHVEGHLDVDGSAGSPRGGHERGLQLGQALRVVARQLPVDRPGKVIEVEQPLGTVEPLYPVVEGGAQQGVRVGPNRQPAVQPPHRAVGVAAEFHQAADRQRGGQRGGPLRRRAVPFGEQGVDVGGPVVDVFLRCLESARHGAAHQRGPAIHVAAARACRVGRPYRLDDLVPQRVRVTVSRRGRPVLDLPARVTPRRPSRR